MIKNGTNLPRAMSLTLLDSKKNEIESELVQFSHSYEVCTPGSLSDNALTSMSNLDQEAVLSALGAFPQHLKEDIPRENISLKYRLRVDGTASWIGLRAAKSTADMWKILLANGSDIIEIGVLVEEFPPNTLVVNDPIVGKDGEPVKTNFFLNGLKWIGGQPNLVDVPPTYEVSRFDEWNGMEAG